MDDARLERLVREYWDTPEHGPALETYLKRLRKRRLPDAIERSGYRLDGKVHDHQRRVGKKKLAQASQAILRNIADLKSCGSFNELHACIRKHTKHISRFGVLAVYDISLRIGACSSIDHLPEAVYLHAGTKKGFKKLGMKTSVDNVEMKALPKPVQKLKPHHAENFLCIYKDRIGGTDRKKQRLPPKKRRC